jgi:hypothetical protein
MWCSASTYSIGTWFRKIFRAPLFGDPGVMLQITISNIFWSGHHSGWWKFTAYTISPGSSLDLILTRVYNSELSTWNNKTTTAFNSFQICTTIINTTTKPPTTAIRPCLGTSAEREPALFFEALDEGSVDKIVEVPEVVLVLFTLDTYTVLVFE